MFDLFDNICHSEKLDKISRRRQPNPTTTQEHMAAIEVIIFPQIIFQFVKASEHSAKISGVKQNDSL